MHLVVIDTETTGLSYRKGARVVEYGHAILDLDSRKLVNKFSSLCNPGAFFVNNPKANGAFKANGIPKREVLKARPDREVAKDARHRIAASTQSPMMFTAYNVGFDSKFFQSPPWAEVAPASLWGPCIMEAARDYVNAHPKKDRLFGDKVNMRVDGSYGNPRLDVIANHFGFLNSVQTHRAGDDAFLAAKVAVKLIKEGFYSP